LADELKIEPKRDRLILAKIGKGKYSDKDIILCLPLTFMNLSGEAVGPLIKRYKAGLDKILVICDDLDLEFGRLKIRHRGSSAGHRGMASIIRCLGSDNFARLRIGVGRPPHQLQNKAGLIRNWCGGRPSNKRVVSDFVLSKFNKREEKDIKQTIVRAVDCCKVWIVEGIQKSMNQYNERQKI